MIAMLMVKEKSIRIKAADQLSSHADEPALLRFCENLPALDLPAMEYAVSALGHVGSPAFIPTLVPVLDRPEPQMRREAVTALGRIGGKAAAELVRSKVLDHDPSVRGAALTALANCGDMQDLPQIVAAMDDSDENTRSSAIGTAGRYLNFRQPNEKRALFSSADVDRTIAALKECGPVALARLCKMLRTNLAPERGRLFTELVRHPAAKVRGAALTALEETDGALALEHARAMLDDEDDINRAASITVIGRQGGADDAPPIRPFLEDMFANVRGAACQAVARLGDVDALDRVIELLQDEDRIVRSSACTATALLNGVQAVPALIRRLDDSESNVRGAAAKALGLLGAVKGLGPLCRSLSDEVPRVRGTCAVALGLIGDPAAVPSLIPLSKDNDHGVRKAAVFALGKIGDPGCLSIVSEALRDEVAEVRWNAANALGRVGDASAVNALVPLLKDPDSHVRGAAATALGWLGDESASEPLVEVATDENAIVRGSVATALGRIADPHTVSALVDLSLDQNAVVRSSAISAVGRARFETGIDRVEAALSDDSAEVRGAALRSIARLRPSLDLSVFLTDSDPSVRRAALAAIGEGTGAGENELILALQDEDEDVRSVAVAALGRRHSETAISSLEAVLEDSSEHVGEAAVQSLGQVVEHRDRQVLIRALSSSHRAVRLAAVEVLTVDGGPGVRPAVEELVRHPDARTRAAAAQALGRIADPQSALVLIETLQDRDSYVRGFAATALSRVGVGSEDARTALLARLDDRVKAVVGLAARALGALGGERVVSALQHCALDEGKSLWTRTAAVQAVAPLFHRPQKWLRALADEYQGSPPRTAEAKFRGAVIDAVIRAAWDDGVAQWVSGVLLEDPDVINQTAAATGLAVYGQLSIEIATRFLAAAPAEADVSQQRIGGAASRRDDAALGAVLRGLILSAASPIELTDACLVVSEALDQSDSFTLANAALSALDSLDAATARAFLDQLNTTLPDDARHRYEALLQREWGNVEGRATSEDAYQRMSQAPERFLQAFIENDAPEECATMAEDCDIGLITIIDEETRAVREWLEQENPQAGQLGPGGNRYVYRATVALGTASPRIVMTQAIDQNQTSATHAAQYLTQHFAPRFLVLLGVAGAIHADVSLGDVVIGTQVIDYGPAASTPDGVRHRGSAFRPPMHVVAALNHYFSGGGQPSSLTASWESAQLGRPSFRLQRGPIGTGPRVIKFKEAEERSFLTNYHEKTLVLETEAEAVARHFYEQGEDGELSGYIVLRAVSDHADEAKDDRWKLAASRNAVLALQKILPSVMDVL